MGNDAKAGRVFADAVEYLCRNAGDLRELVGPDAWDGPFAAVRDAEPGGAAWREAVRALHEAVEAAGVPGGIGLRATLGAGDWPAGPPARSTGRICPTGRCARVDLPGERAADGADPLCALTGGPLRQVD
ncbi:hypothetical protein ABTX81_03040 [Kitasatospora sp. NPDC097605]|uniref:hypothetical protein n=1 Tax=Kitasatospora sp. NPDC097605 TaxID=3157226 RepID=UPI003329AD7A